MMERLLGEIKPGIKTNHAKSGASIRKMRGEMRAGQELLKEEMLAKMEPHHERMMTRMDSQLEKMEACLGKTEVTDLEENESEEEHEEVPEEEDAV
jgi:hypothetical protein